jgi:hypothetical protein
MGIVVTPSPRVLHKKITDLRSERHYSGEFKFSDVRDRNLALYKKLLDVYFSSINSRFTAKVFLKENLGEDLNKAGQVYKLYNRISAQLICASLDKGNYDQSDYIAVVADDITTQIDDNFETEVRNYIKMKTRRNALFGMSRAESHAFSELQVCDVLLGSVAYAFKLKNGLLTSTPNAAKLELVKYLQSKLGVSILAESFAKNKRYGHRFEVVDRTK